MNESEIIAAVDRFAADVETLCGPVLGQLPEARVEPVQGVVSAESDEFAEHEVGEHRAAEHDGLERRDPLRWVVLRLRQFFSAAAFEAHKILLRVLGDTSTVGAFRGGGLRLRHRGPVDAGGEGFPKGFVSRSRRRRPVAGAIGGLLAVLLLVGCNQSDGERTDLIDVDGVRCAVVRNSVGRVVFLDCDWGGQS